MIIRYVKTALCSSVCFLTLVHGSAKADDHGFRKLGKMTDPYPYDTVSIFVAPGSAGAVVERAEKLETALKARGIQVQEHQILLFGSRIQSLLTFGTVFEDDDGPPVMLHGKVKQNPSVADVVAEYESTGAKAHAPDEKPSDKSKKQGRDLSKYGGAW